MDEVKNVMDIQGQVNLKNNSGVDYKNVNLDFVLGDIHTLSYYTPEKPQTSCEINNESGIHVASDQLVVNGKVYRPFGNEDMQGILEREYMLKKDGKLLGIAQDNIYDLKDFYVYHLPFQVQLVNNSPTMATFLSAKDVPYEKEYTFTNLIYLSDSKPSKNVTPALYLTFDTKVLNMPLPQGDFRVFNKHDAQLFFVGESRVKTITMPNQKARVNLGQAMDIYADTQLVDFRELSDTEKLYTYEISIRNLATQNKNVTIKQDLKMDYYTLKDSSLKPTLATPSQLEWTFVLPAERTQTIRFTVIYRNADLIRQRQEKEFDDELCKNKIYGLKSGSTGRPATVYLQTAKAEGEDKQETNDE